MSTRLKLIYFIGIVFGFGLLLIIFNDVRSTYIKVGEFQKELTEVKKSLQSYKDDVNTVTQLNIKILAELDNAKAKNNQLYSDVINNITELYIKTDSISRDTTSAISVNEKTARLAESVRQDYFNLRQQIAENQAMIIGWQKYYCSVISLKNGTEFICSDLNR